MLRRFTAIALLAAAALTAPAAFAHASTATARHCDPTPSAPSASHDGMHHEAPETGPCPHCAATDCLMSTHCVDAGSSLVVVAAVSAVLLPATPRTPHPIPAFASQTITPPTPPPLTSPIAS